MVQVTRLRYPNGLRVYLPAQIWILVAAIIQNRAIKSRHRACQCIRSCQLQLCRNSSDLISESLRHKMLHTTALYSLCIDCTWSSLSNVVSQDILHVLWTQVRTLIAPHVMKHPLVIITPLWKQVETILHILHIIYIHSSFEKSSGDAFYNNR